jgi:hypothetical protein
MANESYEQRKLVNYLRTLHPDILLFAVPNGGSRTQSQASILRKEGVLSGVSDLFIAEPLGEFHGLFLEMKRRKEPGKSRGYLSKTQKEFARDISIRGYAFAVGYGFGDALAKVRMYLQGEHDAYKKTQTSFLTRWSEESRLPGVGPENEGCQGNLQIA